MITSQMAPARPKAAAPATREPPGKPRVAARGNRARPREQADGNGEHGDGGEEGHGGPVQPRRSRAECRWRARRSTVTAMPPMKDPRHGHRGGPHAAPPRTAHQEGRADQHQAHRGDDRRPSRDVGPRVEVSPHHQLVDAETTAQRVLGQDQQAQGHVEHAGHQRWPGPAPGGRGQRGPGQRHGERGVERHRVLAAEVQGAGRPDRPGDHHGQADGGAQQAAQREARIRPRSTGRCGRRALRRARRRRRGRRSGPWFVPAQHGAGCPGRGPAWARDIRNLFMTLSI